MENICDLDLGFNDAENYRKKDYKTLFNQIFVKNYFLDELLQSSKYFLIGEKGTGKTAFAVFLSNNHYKENISELKFIRETDYQKFVTLKSKKHLEFSDYTNIWYVIILLLITKSIQKKELDHLHFNKTTKLNALLQAIDEYYTHAFAPEIMSVLNFIENSKFAAELITKHLKVVGEDTVNTSFTESRFQINLMYIQKQFETALSSLKLKNNHILFIDGIDIRPGSIPYNEYLDCIKGLANATWNINNDFFGKIKDSKGRFRIILLLRPDIFNSIGLQNLTNKIRDNSVYLDWRTTYPSYRSSHLFELSDNLLKAQQKKDIGEIGETWDHYFPWQSQSTSHERDFDPSFYKFLRLSYSRPRDIITMMQILKEEHNLNNRGESSKFVASLFENYNFQNKYSQYLMGGIKDQLSFYYNESDFNMFLNFFHFLEGNFEFTYSMYVIAYQKFIDFVLNNHNDIPAFVETANGFLQFLYDTNILCFIEDIDNQRFFRWCYRERTPSNISPKVSPDVLYRIHYGLTKALHIGRTTKGRF